MSKKLNCRSIVLQHISTLRDNSSQKLSFVDIFAFLIAPLGASICLAYFKNVLSDDLLSLAVNFGAIITALLMSVLVLVYDQESKLLSEDHKEPSKKDEKNRKLNLLRELYQNICFTIVISLFIVVVAFAEMFAKSIGECGFMEYLLSFLTAATTFLFINISMTMLMIIKRFHTLITH